MADPIQRRGEWWQEQPDGGWLKWDEAAGRWQPQQFPPPPPSNGDQPDQPDPAPARQVDPALARSDATGDAPAPTPGYRYERAEDGTWWARNERNGDLHWHDATVGQWRRYVPGSTPAQEPSGQGGRIYAGFWERFAAAFIDGIIVGIASYVLGFFIGLVSITEYSSPQEVEDVSTFAGLAGFVLQWLYFAVMESSSKQATVGKMALDLRVTDEDGNRVGFGKATGRYFAKILSALILFIGFLMVAWTAKKQGLHDRLAGTLVLKGRAR